MNQISLNHELNFMNLVLCVKKFFNLMWFVMKPKKSICQFKPKWLPLLVLITLNLVNFEEKQNRKQQHFLQWEIIEFNSKKFCVWLKAKKKQKSLKVLCKTYTTPSSLDKNRNGNQTFFFPEVEENFSVLIKKTHFFSRESEKTLIVSQNSKGELLKM